MRLLIATTAPLTLTCLIGVWIASRRHRQGWIAVSVSGLVLALALSVGAVTFPRETCELLGGNLTEYDSGPCVNDIGGETVAGIG